MDLLPGMRVVTNELFAEQFSGTLARAHKKQIYGTVVPRRGSRWSDECVKVKWDDLTVPWTIHSQFIRRERFRP